MRWARLVHVMEAPQTGQRPAVPRREGEAAGLRPNRQVPSTLVRRLTRHFVSLQRNRLITRESAAAADAEYEFADEFIDTSKCNHRRRRGGAGRCLPWSIRAALRFSPRLMLIAQEPTWPLATPQRIVATLP